MLTLLAQSSPNLMGLFGCLLIIPMSVWCIVLTRWMISGDIDVISGTVGCMVAVLAVYVSFNTKVPWIPPLVFCGMVIFGALFPSIKWKFTQLELRSIEADRLLTYLNSISQKPDLLQARIEAARILWNLGYPLQCVELARPVEAVTSDAFVAEQREFEIWKAKLALYPSRPLTCLNCGAITDPGNVHCPKCFEIYLVRYVRGSGDAKQAGKMVASWAVIVGIFVLIPSIAASARFEVSIVAIPILLLLGGYTGYQIFFAKE